MQNVISAIFADAATLKSSLACDATFTSAVAAAGERLVKCVKDGGTIYSCGNGGSTCDAMHLTEELVARYKRNRPGIRAMHFMDPGALTCWGNDISFDDTFARYAETFCTPKDVLVAISTSGNSTNVVRAIEAAQRKGSTVIGLTGKDGGKVASLTDITIIVPSQATERIQEIHITCIHAWCELLEQAV